ncbi:hypothetical protein L2E82_09163 [Cichorium intybus]|uniref:Uncharacterized protein n=1 Tax=Cichorium intybus TaxID=13427 RepID=A0ACB9G7F8_CICIN|nr:hypothetical protein L2E82_09163 [Cichorium intybus]
MRSSNSPHVGQDIGSDPINSQEIGPTPNKSQAMGRKYRKKTSSFDLNAQPSQSLESRLSQVSLNDNSPQADNMMQPLTQDDSTDATLSLYYSREIEATMEIGEKIGFQFGGKKDQLNKLIRNKGDVNVSQ